MNSNFHKQLVHLQLYNNNCFLSKSKCNLVRQRKFQSWKWAKTKEWSTVKQIFKHRKWLNFFWGIHNYKEIIRRRFKTVLLPCLWCCKPKYLWCLYCPLCSVTTICFKCCYKWRKAVYSTAYSFSKLNTAHMAFLTKRLFKSEIIIRAASKQLLEEDEFTQYIFSASMYQEWYWDSEGHGNWNQ